MIQTLSFVRQADLFPIWRIVTSDAGGYVLMRGDEVRAQGSMRTICLNPNYSRAVSGKLGSNAN